MRFIMFMIPSVYQSQRSADDLANFAPDAKTVGAMMKYNEELAKAGALVSLDGLHPSSKGARVKFSAGKKPVVTDGPFTESKEVVGGYWLINVKSLEEAIEWAQKVPAAEGDTIEVRQIFEMSDFPPDVQQAADSPTVREAVEKKNS